MTPKTSRRNPSTVLAISLILLASSGFLLSSSRGSSSARKTPLDCDTVLPMTPEETAATVGRAVDMKCSNTTTLCAVATAPNGALCTFQYDGAGGFLSCSGDLASHDASTTVNQTCNTSSDPLDSCGLVYHEGCPYMEYDWKCTTVSRGGGASCTLSLQNPAGTWGGGATWHMCTSI